MMAPDYTQWHGFYEVAERFYMELVPQAHEPAEKAIAAGRRRQGESVLAAIGECPRAVQETLRPVSGGGRPVPAESRPPRTHGAKILR